MEVHPVIIILKFSNLQMSHLNPGLEDIPGIRDILVVRPVPYTVPELSLDLPNGRNMRSRQST